MQKICTWTCRAPTEATNDCNGEETSRTAVLAHIYRRTFVIDDVWNIPMENHGVIMIIL